MYVLSVLCLYVCLTYLGPFLSGSIGAEIINPADRFKCKPSWDLPIEYTNVTRLGSASHFEYGQYVWEGQPHPAEQQPTYNPFITLKDPLPQRNHDLILDCPSAIAIGRAACEDTMRSVCDSYCELKCLTSCSKAGTAEELTACMHANSLDGCYFNVQHSVWLKARACRKVFPSVLFQYPHQVEDATEEKTTAEEETTVEEETTTEEETTSEEETTIEEITTIEGTSFSTTFESTTYPPWAIEANISSMTVYVVEVFASNVKEVNWKRVRRSTLSLALEEEYILDPITPDFGNLIDPISTINLDTCDVTSQQVLHSPLDRPDRIIHTNRLGSSYFIQRGSADKTVIDSHITSLMSASALHGSKGYPEQFMVWWPGMQPLFANKQNYTEDDIFLKVIFQGYSAHYISVDGFVVLPNSAGRGIQIGFIFSCLCWIVVPVLMLI
eukprot:Gregarina_sp_Poly_1__8402@NODE_493_length_7956_cov_236_715173_g397_i0_p1_GENE_NODE_493_length_7956_cov_236_715173_g397_i0NODE_493_length_7956_cov_236_715173_g397_i0_p1_ORF_typecomplete_len441_score37_90MEA1/PF06910_11/0_064Mucin/PF01456_17/0_31Olee6/PF09253_10/1_NODE_493_length_7956_cov_236_715173_g397_i057777099